MLNRLLHINKLFFALLLSAFSLTSLHAQDVPQPPTNYGLTTILDGAPPMPGLYYMGYLQHYKGTFKDYNGETIKPNGVHALQLRATLAMNQFSWITKLKVLGGHFEVTTLIPVVHLDISSPYNLVGKSGLGDIVVGPGIQWFDHKLFGKPFLHRFEIDFILPTGFYDDQQGTRPINASSGFMTIEPYWSQTLFLSSKNSISLRHHLTHNRYYNKIPNVEYQVGMMYHMNYSFERVISGKFKPYVSDEYRLALSGYYAQQITMDKINGEAMENTGESVFAVGPSLHWITKTGFVVELKAAYEVFAKNRPQGLRTTFRVVHLFKPKKKKE